MSVFSQFFTGPGSEAPHFTDPRKMQKFVGDQTVTKFSNNAASATGFWDAVAFNGVYTDTNFSADTYKTILNVTGSAGVLLWCIGPVMVNATDNTTFRVTVDSIAYTVVVEAYNANDRAGIGPLIMTDVFTTTNNFNTPNFTRVGVAGDFSVVHPDTNAHLFPTSTAFMLGTSMLKFNSSLLVEVKCTTAQSGTASRERRSGLCYQLLGGA